MNDEKNRDKSTSGERDYWDLGGPRSRIYEKAEFSDDSLGVTEVMDENTTAAHPAGETIPKRGTHSPTVVKTIHGSRIVTDSYKNRSSRGMREKLSLPRTPSAPEGVITASYENTGPLISKIDVKSRATETEFYGKFAANARRIHLEKNCEKVSSNTERVPYFSYVPQYSHMNLSQIEFYKSVRQSITLGEYPECDLSYVLLFIYEIINLPDLISPEEGLKLLSGIWLGYRKIHPRLDTYLCEWLPDYCMIRGLALPECIMPILPEIIPKAQFKEFYFNVNIGDITSTAEHVNTGEAGFILAKSLIELSSDYDYRTAKYYTENKTAYDTLIPAALSHVMHNGMTKKRGIFTLERIYKVTRDSYSGAVASSGIKRWLELEYCSFTRRADTRDRVTALVKYAENKLRVILGIKAKLSVGEITPEDIAVIDRFFDPVTPISQKIKAEDRYMPTDYMKNYDSEDSGFDFATASEIEMRSWSNTALLTGEDTVTLDELELTPIPGEISFDTVSTYEAEELTDITEETTATEELNDDSADEIIKDAVKSAIDGSYRTFCRECGIHEGELADRINNVFLDVVGDVILEDHGSGFELIEDYREDVLNWLL